MIIIFHIYHQVDNFLFQYVGLHKKEVTIM